MKEEYRKTATRFICQLAKTRLFWCWNKLTWVHISRYSTFTHNKTFQHTMKDLVRKGDVRNLPMWMLSNCVALSMKSNFPNPTLGRYVRYPPVTTGYFMGRRLLAFLAWQMPMVKRSNIQRNQRKRFNKSSNLNNIKVKHQHALFNSNIIINT